MLPRRKRELIILSTGAAVVVILTFLVIEILHAPLMILDAKSDLADPTQAESKRTFTLSVQGPIVDLHKSLSRLMHQRVRYRAKGTGLVWLDYEQKKSNAIKVRNIARRKLLLQDTNPPFDCATCKGSLHAADFFYLLGLLTACISVTAMLPVIIKVAVISGNGVGHVFAALACKQICFCAYVNLIRCFFESFNLVLCFAVMERHSAPRLLQLCVSSSGCCCCAAALPNRVADPTVIS